MLFTLSRHINSWCTPFLHVLHIPPMCLICVFTEYHRIMYPISEPFASTGNVCFSHFHGIPTHDVPHFCTFCIYPQCVLFAFSRDTIEWCTPYLHLLHLPVMCFFHTYEGTWYFSGFTSLHWLRSHWNIRFPDRCEKHTLSVDAKGADMGYIIRWYPVKTWIRHILGICKTCRKGYG